MTIPELHAASAATGGTVSLTGIDISALEWYEVAVDPQSSTNNALL